MLSHCVKAILVKPTNEKAMKPGGMIKIIGHLQQNQKLYQLSVDSAAAVSAFCFGEKFVYEITYKIPDRMQTNADSTFGGNFSLCVQFGILKSCCEKRQISGKQNM